MKKIRYIAFIAVLLLIPLTIYANSAEYPALIVILKNAPNDTMISLSSNQNIEGQKRNVAWETYYAFYYRDLHGTSDIQLNITGGGTSFQKKIPISQLDSYDNIVTLDFLTQTVTQGKLLSRSILLVLLRVTLTLLIEGIVFLLFAFRKKESWIAFIIINLITQGALNIALNGISPYASYPIFNLLGYEMVVFFTEIFAFTFFIKEHSFSRCVAYVFVANFISLILGGNLIMKLPI